jgi:hypothetical protein
MIDNKTFSDQEVLLAEAIMKLASIERLLIKAKVFTEKDMVDEMKIVSDEVIMAMKNTLKTITEIKN